MLEKGWCFVEGVMKFWKKKLILKRRMEIAVKKVQFSFLKWIKIIVDMCEVNLRLVQIYH